MNLKFLGKRFVPFLGIILLLLLLPFILKLTQTAQYYLGEASGKKANITIDTKAVLGPVPQVWQALSQGGEENEKMLESVISEIAALKPKYIRIDHVFDHFGVVNQKNGKIVYNFSRLDKIIDDVLKTGALPFISLSYMPPEISRDGNITSPPANWMDWENLIQATIEHLSGRPEKNLKDIYYEVWNEPDLFGRWKIGKDPDYRLLYQHAAAGAKKAQNVNRFFLGGPATTGLYQNWLQALFNLGEKLDFISWHRYEPDPVNIEKDVTVLESFLEKNPEFFYIEKFLTEWGSVSEISPYHDSEFDAAHAIATIRKLLTRVDLAFSFEIKDGPDPAGKKYWGRWGLLTHESAGVEKKPRYHALSFLNQMTGSRLSLWGEGTWVSGLTSTEGKKIRLLLVNFDPRGKHSETVPVTFINLPQSSYSYKQSFLLGKSQTTTEILTSDVLQKNIFMPVNSLVLIELEPK